MYISPDTLFGSSVCISMRPGETPQSPPPRALFTGTTLIDRESRRTHHMAQYLKIHRPSVLRNYLESQKMDHTYNPGDLEWSL